LGAAGARLFVFVTEIPGQEVLGVSLRTNPDKSEKEKFPKLYAYVLTDHTLLSPLHFHPRTHEQVGRASPYHNRNKSIR
jgi:hypothetical protein